MTASARVDTVGLLTPQQIIDAALAASVADGCVVVVNSSSSANIRWANNTVTTNGVTVDLSWFVVAAVDGAASTVAGSASDAASAGSVAAVVSAAHAAAVASARLGPARDAQPLVEPGTAASDDFADGPGQTSFAVFDSLVDGLADGFGAARSADRVLYGFAEHDITTTYLGSSTGLRLRWVQPTGTLEVNAKSADLRRSAWSGVSTPDFVGVDLAAVLAPLNRRLDWAKRTVELPPGRYRTVLPPTAVADFMITMAWNAGAREAHEGRSAFAAPGGGTRSGERLTNLKLTMFSDPALPGLAAAPFLVAGYSSDDDLGVRQRRTDRSARFRRRRRHRFASAHPRVRGGVRRAVHPQRRQPGAHRRGRGPRHRRPGRGCRSRAAADVAVVHPRGGPDDAAAHRSHPGRGVPGRGGEVVGAVNNFRFNMSPLDVLRQAADVGATVPTLSREWSDWFTRTAMPPITVDGFNMSSVSQAT